MGAVEIGQCELEQAETKGGAVTPMKGKDSGGGGCGGPVLDTLCR